LTRHVITGGSGFLGQHLASVLRKAGQEVLVFDLVPPPHGGRAVIGDLRDPAVVRELELGPDDVVHHLAARQFHLPVPRRGRDRWFMDVNVDGTAALIEGMKRTGACRMIFFSTDMTYGRPSQTPVCPDHPQVPIGPYGRSKLAAERLIKAAVQEQALAATIFRPRLIAGPGRLGILERLFRLVHAGLPVPMIGGGKNRYQMISVADCVSAALCAVGLGCPFGPFNLGSEDPPTVRSLLTDLIVRAQSRSVLVPTPAPVVQSVLGLLDHIGRPLLYPEQFEIANLDYVLDTTTTQEGLGWRPAHGDQDMLWQAFERFRSATYPFDVPRRRSLPA